MELIEKPLEEFKRMVLAAGVPVRIVRTRLPTYRIEGNQAVSELVTVVTYRADVMDEAGQLVTWTCRESRPITDVEDNLRGLLYDELPNKTFLHGSGSF